MSFQKLQLGIIVRQESPEFFLQASLCNCINCVHCDDHFFISKLFCQKNHAGFVFLGPFVLGLPHRFILISNKTMEHLILQFRSLITRFITDNGVATISVHFSLLLSTKRTMSAQD